MKKRPVLLLYTRNPVAPPFELKTELYVDLSQPKETLVSNQGMEKQIASRDIDIKNLRRSLIKELKDLHPAKENFVHQEKLFIYGDKNHANDVDIGGRKYRIKEVSWAKYYTVAIYFIRIGHLFFIDYDVYNKLTAPLQKTLATNAIIIKKLDSTNLGDSKYRDYTISTIIAMMNNKLENMQVIDCGSGEGSLSLAALRLGADFVELIEKKDFLLSKAKENFEVNRFLEGTDYRCHLKDLKDTESIASDLKNTKKRVAIVSNIGTWESLYDITNTHSIKLAKKLPDVALLILGGYAASSDYEYDSIAFQLEVLRKHIAGDQELLGPEYTIGTKMAGKHYRGEILTAATWVATKKIDYDEVAVSARDLLLDIMPQEDEVDLVLSLGVRPGDKAIEIGTAGMPSFPLLIYALGGMGIGIELDPDLNKAAEEWIEYYIDEHDLSRFGGSIKQIEGNFLSYAENNIKDGEFRFVICSAVLTAPRTLDRSHIFSEILRIVQDEGEIVLGSFDNSDEEYDEKGVINEVLESREWKGKVRLRKISSGYFRYKSTVYTRYKVFKTDKSENEKPQAGQKFPSKDTRVGS